ncbi:hypothetical protein NC652_012636 [Populus alba x Populus x berolinensis]|uniref:Uncharacterized protein n=1 Tax=Populus alba x Populus x berolinensis TaxID=444605 RepID=A0AAD6QSG7_9ROSI|nr:hypothetical protein NC651_012280 [Populus alba x Populus x berolinensis]KAJ6928569.1 hypothetical protein NC652_012636 [Populus alba x Populus x berolinensis]KAJ6995832.1 hypothetical protein NC653_012640 [Populus alba x Populus x berolinensis]
MRFLFLFTNKEHFNNTSYKKNTRRKAFH